MQRRLPSEPKHLIEQLTSWIAWRYTHVPKSLVLTSAPSSLPLELQQWRPDAVWRLAWQSNGAAILYGIAAAPGPNRYFVARHDGRTPIRQSTFERQGDGKWSAVEGDGLALLFEVADEERQVA